MQYSIFQKSQLEGVHRLDVEDWFKYIKPIYKKRKSIKNFENSRLVQIIDSNNYKRLSQLIGRVIRNVKNARQIFGIVKQLNNKGNPDEKIDDMIGELRAAWYLIDRGYKIIRYQKSGLDFACKDREGDGCFAEIKFIRGSDFKTQKRNIYGSYSLSPDKLNLILQRKYSTAEEQIEKHTSRNRKQLVIIVTNLLEADKFWFGETIEKWRLRQKIKTVILTNGDIYE